MIRTQCNPSTSLQCKMQTKDSIHLNQSNLQKFDAIQLIIKYATICCNESISYFGEYFSNLLIITNIQKYYFRWDTMNGSNSDSMKNILNHINNTNNHHNNYYNDIITILYPIITTKIQQHYSFVATEMIGNINHQQSLFQIDQITQCLFTKFLKNCMECMIPTNDNHQIVLLPDFIFNHNLYPSYSNIENEFESILTKLCHKHGMMAPINIPKFDINQQILLHDAINIAISDQLPSKAPLLSCNRSRSLSSDSVPLQNSMNHNNGVNNNNNDTSSICAVFEGETGRVNIDSLKNNNNNNNNNNFQLNQLNHINTTSFNSGHQQQQQTSNYGQIINNNNNNNNNNIQIAYNNNYNNNNIMNPRYITNPNPNPINRNFQSVSPFNHYQKPIQSAKYMDNKNKRRLAVQSHINSIKSNLKSQQYQSSGYQQQQYNITNITNTTRSTPMPYSAYSTYSAHHHQQQKTMQLPPIPVLPPLPLPIKPIQCKPIQSIQSIQRFPHRTINRLTPRHYQSRNNHNNYVSNLNIRSNIMRYPKNVIIANNGDSDVYQTVLKDYIYNEDYEDDQDDDNDNKLKYGEARLSEIVNIKNIIKKPHNNEYENVSERFLKFTNLSGLNLDVIKIYKIRNDKLLDDYDHRKESIRRGLDNDLNKLNEKCLYHGTSIHVIPKIITQGFLRQFTTRHAFGQGCYFAVNAAYSTHPRYATPNNQGLQFIFVCSVICGEFCKGNANMKVPDIKPNTNNILYETTCNDINKPTVFVTFNDNQAIPRYLIIFKNKNLKVSNK